MWAAILFRKEESDLLSLISFGIEFQNLAPLYMKLFFMLLERGFGKQRPVHENIIPQLFQVSKGESWYRARRKKFQ
jgi:hypothetical protein